MSNAGTVPNTTSRKKTRKNIKNGRNCSTSLENEINKTAKKRLAIRDEMELIRLIQQLPLWYEKCFINLEEIMGLFMHKSKLVSDVQYICSDLKQLIDEYDEYIKYGDKRPPKRFVDGDIVVKDITEIKTIIEKLNKCINSESEDLLTCVNKIFTDFYKPYEPPPPTVYTRSHTSPKLKEKNYLYFLMKEYEKMCDFDNYKTESKSDEKVLRLLNNVREIIKTDQKYSEIPIKQQGGDFSKNNRLKIIRDNLIRTVTDAEFQIKELERYLEDFTKDVKIFISKFKEIGENQVSKNVKSIGKNRASKNYNLPKTDNIHKISEHNIDLFENLLQNVNKYIKEALLIKYKEFRRLLNKTAKNKILVYDDFKNDITHPHPINVYPNDIHATKPVYDIINSDLITKYIERINVLKTEMDVVDSKKSPYSDYSVGDLYKSPTPTKSIDDRGYFSVGTFESPTSKRTLGRPSSKPLTRTPL